MVVGFTEAGVVVVDKVVWVQSPHCDVVVVGLTEDGEVVEEDCSQSAHVEDVAVVVVVTGLLVVVVVQSCH